jgi:hypothetical protein
MSTDLANGLAGTSAAHTMDSWALYGQLSLAAALIVTTALLALLLVPLRRGARARLQQFKQDEHASASLEFLLVFFPLLVLVLAVWQLAFMINAQVHVGYAAYAAARSASTVAFSELDDEPEGILLNINEPNAEKWGRIQSAAIPGTLAISPGSAESATRAYLSTQANKLIGDGPAPNFDAIDLANLPGQTVLLTAHRPGTLLQNNRMRRTAVKALYAQSATRVLINGRDARGNLENGNKANDPFDVSGGETLSVTVEYDFWLHVPYAGRMMYIAFGGSELTSSITEPTLTLSRTVVTPAWPQLKAF